MSPTEPNVPMTMSFAVMGLGTVFSGLVMRRDPDSGLNAPILGAIKILLIPTAMTVLGVEWGWLRGILGTVDLTSGQWMSVIGYAVLVALVVEVYKVFRRSRLAKEPALARGVEAVVPERVRGA